MRAISGIFLVLGLLFAFSGCTTVKGDPYIPGEIHAQSVLTGTISHVGASSVTTEPTMVGPLVGGAVGALAGGAVIGGSGAMGTIGILAGGALGAVAGGAGEMNFRKTDHGLALTVDLDNGNTIVIAQPEDDIYTVGDRVRVMRDADGYGRVRLQ